MKLTPLDLHNFPFGKPLPFALRTRDGTLLAAAGFVVNTRAQLDTMVTRAGVLCIDLAESPDQARAFMGQLDDLVRTEHTIGQIAAAQMTGAQRSAPTDTQDRSSSASRRSTPPDWQEIQLRATALLRHPETPDFMPRLQRLHTELQTLSAEQPDATLFALIHFGAREIEMYSATHALLVAVICGMAARDHLHWEPAMIAAAAQAALTMNIGMTVLQDELARQATTPSESQMARIAVHAAASEKLLERHGVSDPLWLGAVRHHHAAPSGKLAAMEPSLRVARLIERADIFAARLAPRTTRWALPAAAAMRGTYFDAEHRVDEAGASLITAMGVYPPGSFVKLANYETAIVLKRGRTGTTPRAAAVLNRQGAPLGEIATRDTSQANFKVMSSVAHREVKVQLALDRMLNLI
jgi:hypothetical protein